MKYKHLCFCLIMFIASAVLLTVIQPPFNLSILAYAALVPFIFACLSAEKLWPLLLASYAVSLFYWLGNLYWLIPVTTAGWFAMCLYLALLWPIIAVALRCCFQKKIPLLLTVPVLFVGAERLQGFFFGGFFWRHLSHSQYDNLPLIQIADIFGAAGVSFLIALVNGLAAEFILSATRRRQAAGGADKSAGGQSACGGFTRSIVLKTALVFAVVIATIFYGQWRIGQFEKATVQGPLVGSVQSCIPQSVKESATESNEVAIETFNRLAADSNAIADAGAVLSLWPETMVPAYLDDRLLGLLAEKSIHKYFHNRLCSIAKGRAYLLIGAPGLKPKINNDYTIEAAEKYNSAFLYKPDGQQSIDQYNKIHLVPFGEFVPFKKTIPFLHRLLMKFTPYDYDYSLDAGSEFTIFQINTVDKKNKESYKFAVMICYEDSVPKIARGFVLDRDGQKRVNWLVNISNDGWFVKFTDGQTIYGEQSRTMPSTELVQHATVCVFRAVENRVAIMRSVNTGISCLIDSSGKIRDGFLAGNLPKKALERRGMAGWFVDKMPIDNRVTFFGRYGQWLDNFCAVCLAAAAVLALVRIGGLFKQAANLSAFCAADKRNTK
jgi:apolipoprotein N-acyltransferase